MINKICIDCGRPVTTGSRARCRDCYYKIGGFREGNDGCPRPADRNPNWKGGNKIEQGYVLIYSPEHPKAVQNYVREHRLVVEKFIGRYLNKEEVIHHIDENRQNNHISNLMLFKNQIEHSKFHTKIKQFGMTNPIRRQIAERWSNVKGK